MLRLTSLMEGERLWHFETEETVKKCIKCEREYKTRNYCLRCSKEGKKVPCIEQVKHRMGAITKSNVKEYSCECFFSSTMMFSEYWKKVKKDKNMGYCKHYRVAMDGIKKKRTNA